MFIHRGSRLCAMRVWAKERPCRCPELCYEGMGQGEPCRSFRLCATRVWAKENPIERLQDCVLWGCAPRRTSVESLVDVRRHTGAAGLDKF